MVVKDITKLTRCPVCNGMLLEATSDIEVYIADIFVGKIYNVPSITCEACDFTTRLLTVEVEGDKLTIREGES